MAVQSEVFGGVSGEQINSLITSIGQRHPSPDVSPYLESRALAGLLGQYMQGTSQHVQGTVTTNADSATDDLEVLTPFTPKAVILHNETDGLAYIKLSTHAGLFSIKATFAGPVLALANNTVKMGNKAGDNPKGFTLNNAEIAGAGKVLHFLAIG